MLFLSGADEPFGAVFEALDSLLVDWLTSLPKETEEPPSGERR
jgi:hypothetical protein